VKIAGRAKLGAATGSSLCATDRKFRGNRDFYIVIRSVPETRASAGDLHSSRRWSDRWL